VSVVLEEHTRWEGVDGKPIVGGKVFFGTQGQDPTIGYPFAPVNLITVYTDRALTVVAANPQTTTSNGRTTNKIYVPDKYSIAVWDSDDVQKYINLDAGRIETNSESVSFLQAGAGAVERTSQDKHRERISVKDFGVKADGSDDTTALNVAFTDVPVGGTLDFKDFEITVNTVSTITRSDLRCIGDGAKIISGATVSGDSGVVEVTGTRTNIIFDGIEFDANGQRARGLKIAATCSECKVLDTDAFYYTAYDGVGISVPSDTQVTLKPVPLFLQTQQFAVSLVTGGTLPQPNVFRFFPVQVDALGREGIVNVPSDATTEQTTDASNRSVKTNWFVDPSARSYRMYLLDKDIIGEWQRYYSVPIPNTAPSTMNHTITADWAGKQTTPTAVQITGQPVNTFTDRLFRPYYFRIAAVYSDGQNSQSGNSQPFVFSQPDNSELLIRLTWAAPVGATPTSYKLYVSTEETGGPRNFFQCLDVGNVLTYDFTGITDFVMEWPYSNEDELQSPGGRERNLSGRGKAILNGETFQMPGIPGTDNTYQFQSIATTSGETPSDFFAGMQLRKQHFGASTVTVEWGLGSFGDSDKYWIYNYVTGKTISLYSPNGVTHPGQLGFMAFLNATETNVTGDGTVVTIPFANEDHDSDGDFNTTTNLGTTVIAGTYEISCTVLVTVTANTTSIGLTIKAGSKNFLTESDNMPGSTKTFSFSRTIKVSMGAAESISATFQAGGSSLDVDIIGHASNHYTTLSANLVY